MFSTIHASFSFLSILVKGKIYTDKQMQKSIYYYPLIGGIIAFLASSITMLVFYFFFQKELCAIIFLFLECILSRGLHHDGLCDIVDAYGSGKTKEKFREILKDSRIGSFGVIALIFYFLFGTFSIAHLINMNIFSVEYYDLYQFVLFMTLGGMWNRLGLICLPTFSQLYLSPTPAFSLAKIMFSNYKKVFFYLWLCLLSGIIYYCYGHIMLLSLIVITILFTFPLVLLAKREDGYNGDFLGATCLLWEISYYLAGIITITR